MKLSTFVFIMTALATFGARTKGTVETLGFVLLILGLASLGTYLAVNGL